jgi:hypothetical protein
MRVPRVVPKGNPCRPLHPDDFVAMPNPDAHNLQPIVLLGAGGHAKVVADAILSRGGTVAGFYDDASEPALVLPGAVHLGPLDGAGSETRPVILAIGGLAARRSRLAGLPALQ